MTGQIALQLAKFAGLKVACVADLARNGQRLNELGADFMVDRYDTKRAIEILKAVTGNKLRFGIDTVGKETAESLQEALTSTSGGRSHILGLSGLPKEAPHDVVQHAVPIKIFHEDPNVGEQLSQWLEELLVAKSLKLPEVEVADGGLAGVNAALDRLRSGEIGGKRIVVPVGAEAGTPRPESTQGNGYGSQAETDDLSYFDQMNSEPDRVKFAYWVPNVSGGLVISKIPQRTDWKLEANQRYARTAERWGFEYALSQIRFMAGYGKELESMALACLRRVIH